MFSVYLKSSLLLIMIRLAESVVKESLHWMNDTNVGKTYRDWIRKRFHDESAAGAKLRHRIMWIQSWTEPFPAPNKQMRPPNVCTYPADVIFQQDCATLFWSTSDLTQQGTHQTSRTVIPNDKKDSWMKAHWENCLATCWGVWYSSDSGKGNEESYSQLADLCLNSKMTFPGKHLDWRTK